MKKTVLKYLPDACLAIVYFIGVAWLLKWYPVPQFTWDSYYYVNAGITGEYGVRPMGYPIFLKLLYHFNESVYFVIWLQFLAYFICSIFFLKVLARVLNLPLWAYSLLGMLLLLEPTSLYHANMILSDSLFDSLTISAIAFLVLYLNNGKYWALLLHIPLVFICIELRHIALFYPFFSCIVLLVFTKKNLKNLSGVVLLLLVFFAMQQWHILQNKKRYGIPVYTAFSGWTYTNNALYALPLIKLDPATIENPEIRSMHTFFKNYLDTTSFSPGGVGSGFLWDDRSPMNIIRKKYVDSLQLDYNTSWFYCAPVFHNYGSFIQRHYPIEYFKGYMLPNVETLLHPVEGEIGDYFITPYFDGGVLNRYHLTEAEVRPVRQVFKEKINGYISKGYSILLWTFVVCCVALLTQVRRLGKEEFSALAIVIFFVFSFYGLTLYSSWFMFRYLLPVYPLMSVIIIFALRFFLAGKFMRFPR